MKTIRTKRPDLHRRWMIRNYALTLAAVMLRLWLGIFMFAFGGENFVASYTVIAWLCWVPNAITAEWYLRGRRSISAVDTEGSEELSTLLDEERHGVIR